MANCHGIRAMRAALQHGARGLWSRLRDPKFLRRVRGMGTNEIHGRGLCPDPSTLVGSIAFTSSSSNLSSTTRSICWIRRACTSWNPGAKRFKGYEADEIIGAAFLGILHGGSEREPESACEGAGGGGANRALRRGRVGGCARTARGSGPMLSLTRSARRDEACRLRQDHPRSDRAKGCRGQISAKASSSSG